MQTGFKRLIAQLLIIIGFILVIIIPMITSLIHPKWMTIDILSNCWIYILTGFIIIIISIIIANYYL